MKVLNTTKADIVLQNIYQPNGPILRKVLQWISPSWIRKTYSIIPKQGIRPQASLYLHRQPMKAAGTP